MNTGWCIQLREDISLPQSLTLINTNYEKMQDVTIPENTFLCNNYSIIFGYSSYYDYSTWPEEEKIVSYRI